MRLHADVAVRWARLLGAGAEAEDVAQDAFVKAYSALSGFRPGMPFRPWLLRIVQRETSNLRRSAARRRAREVAAGRDRTAVLAAASPDPAAAAEAGALHTRLWAAVEALPEEQRLVVCCRYLLELDEAETAVALGLRRGTVKSRLHRGLVRLRAAEGLDR
ncbi:MAG TPA: sigma-70 family RNA polymerase sigma factor [Dermatophilaceae bacterium]|nr:sigma-70 family RNA polymerase sigma factor [Dermatophilaceae bacterium]